MKSKVLLANHFDLETVCGTSVMFRELLPVASRVASTIDLTYLSFERIESPEKMRGFLSNRARDTALVIAVNAQIEVAWPLTQALVGWSSDRGVPTCVYVHDYWPQHKAAMDDLLARGARLLASTPWLAKQLGDAGYAAQLVQVGVPLPAMRPNGAQTAPSNVVATAGRLVARKRLADIPAAFAMSGLDGAARLYMRLLPSHVFAPQSDAEELEGIRKEVARGGLTSAELDMRSSERRPPYEEFAVYVCSSFYEGFSMPVIEAAFHGCPPIMSDIPPHRAVASILFGQDAAMLLFPVGDRATLATMLRDEIETGCRRARLHAHLREVQDRIIDRWSLERMALSLEALTR